MNRDEAILKGKEFMATIDGILKATTAAMGDNIKHINFAVEDINEILNTKYNLEELIELYILMKLIAPELLATFYAISDIVHKDGERSKNIH